MLCNGICKTKHKKCGLLKELIVKIDSKTETIEKCVFGAMLDSMIRSEQADIRIQAAIEHSRNQQNTDELESRKAIAHGFVGLIHTFQNNPEAVKQAGLSKAKLIKMIELTDAKQEKIAEDQIDIASGENG